jgi:hypothetical protein
MLKKFTIASGLLFILLAMVTVKSNPLVGKNALFATDLIHNLIHWFIGGFLIFIAIWHLDYVHKVYRVIGVLFILLAIIGSWSTGFETGNIFGLIMTNGVAHIFSLFVGVLFIVIGTSKLRN